MFNTKHDVSMVTAILPNPAVHRVVKNLVQEKNTNVFSSAARGTLLHESWWKSWLPSISPSKTMLRMVVPTSDVDNIVSGIIVDARLHKQALGAVFSTPCKRTHIGSEFNSLADMQSHPGSDSHGLSETLSAIYCSVGHQLSERVAKAAIHAGAHGPVVYYAEGRGLRDRLGWLRITKDSEQEVLMVIADNNDCEQIFDAMAKAGGFHLPGRGLMYRLPIDKGMFNLSSRVSNHHYPANTQQIINAIDHLAGHAHWRDQSIFDVGKDGRGVGLESLRDQTRKLGKQMCFSAIVNRDQSQDFTDLMLNAGAPGVNVNYARFIDDHADDYQLAHASIVKEYAAMRCVLSYEQAEAVADAIEKGAEAQGIRDLCVLVHDVPRVAKYIPGAVDYRAA
ncbi:MAG: hypothetical protein AAGA33_00510 [Pseudomonadota bacterium]